MMALGLDMDKIAKIDALYGMDVKEACALCPDSQGSAELLALFEAIELMGLSEYCMFDFGIIRGLDYYTGTVFEVFDEAPENNRAMFGGGRYDNLVGLFVKNAKISGVGFGFGDVTLENFLVTHKLVPEKLVFGNKVLVARFEDVPAPKYADIASKLRESGIVCSVYLGAKKFGKQIDYAIKDGYTHVLIMGGDELAAGQFKLKDLEARTEETYSLSALDDATSIFN